MTEEGPSNYMIEMQQLLQKERAVKTVTTIVFNVML